MVSKRWKKGVDGQIVQYSKRVTNEQSRVHQVATDN